MVSRVLIIGGYGNFGGYIARRLAEETNVQLVIGGRSLERARAFAAALPAANAVEAAAIDIDDALGAALAGCRPDIVIHTVGPFQKQDYRVARAAIAAGSHYLDLADARRFVAEFASLDRAARAADVLAVSGASSVPCLTAAIVDHYRPRFAALEAVDYGISAAQQTNRGLATTSAVLSYVGKPFTMLRDGVMRTVHGWQDTHSFRYPSLGRRWFGNCDIPDLTLFPARYPDLRSMRFAAGHEIAALHFGTWCLGWLVRLQMLPSLDKLAAPLLRLALLFDPLGSARSTFHMVLAGLSHDGARKRICFKIEARSGHGPYIPCMPAILLAKRLVAGSEATRGARPCLDLIDLHDYLAALEPFDITVTIEGDDD